MDSRQGYYNGLYSRAIAAGLPPAQARLAASQGSLESGFGQHVVGGNIFGIKASPSYTGSTVNAMTSEEQNGVSTRQPAQFRAYASPADSFSDYTGLLSRSYPDAYNAADFDSAVDGLNTGLLGRYATDTKYGSKLRSIDSRYAPQAVNSYVDSMVTTQPQTAKVTPVQRGLLSAPTDPMNVPGANVTPGIDQRLAATQVGIAPQAAPQTNVQVSQPQAVQSGLMSPQEYSAYQAQKGLLSAAPVNKSVNATHVSQVAQKALGTIAGGLLGGVALGPIGGLLGAYVGKQLTSPNGLFGNNNFPTRPDSSPRGDGSLTPKGESVSRSSGQFAGAMAKGGIGLY